MEPLKFPTNTIPIIGQPFALKGWVPTVMITCNCEAKEPVLIVGVMQPAQCPACKRGFVVGAIQYNGQTGQNEVGIATVVLAQEKKQS